MTWLEVRAANGEAIKNIVMEMENYGISPLAR